MSRWLLLRLPLLRNLLWTASLYLADSLVNSAVALRWAANSASEFGSIRPPGPRVTGSRGSWGGLLGTYEWLELDLEGWPRFDLDLWDWRPRLELELGVGGIALKGVAPEPLAVGAPLGLYGVLCCGGNIGNALDRVLAGLSDGPAAEGLDELFMVQ
jgi:hypothetical protein